jgi:hypothetical protein
MTAASPPVTVRSDQFQVPKSHINIVSVVWGKELYTPVQEELKLQLTPTQVMPLLTVIEVAEPIKLMF